MFPAEHQDSPRDAKCQEDPKETTCECIKVVLKTSYANPRNAVRWAELSRADAVWKWRKEGRGKGFLAKDRQQQVLS